MLMPWRCSTSTATTRPGRGRRRPASRGVREWSCATPSESYQTVNSSTAVPRKERPEQKPPRVCPCRRPQQRREADIPEAESAASEHPAHEVESARHSGADSATDEQRPATAQGRRRHAPTIINSQAICVSRSGSHVVRRR